MDVTLQASLTDLPFAGITAFLAQRRATGVLEITNPHGTSRAFFLDGHPQGAKLSHLTFPLGRVLAATGRVAEEALRQALDEQAQSGKLLGQVLIDRQVLTEQALQEAFEEQSRLSFLSLFGLQTARCEFLNGLVHLCDFTSAPMAPVVAIYRGIRDFAPTQVYEPLLARLCFAAITIAETARDLVTSLPSPEREATQLLLQPTFSGIVARRAGLSPKALGALLYSLYSLGALTIGAPRDVIVDPVPAH